MASTRQAGAAVPPIRVNDEVLLEPPIQQCPPLVDSRHGSVSTMSDFPEKGEIGLPGTQVRDTKTEAEPRKGRFHFSVWNGIYLKTPFWMVVFFFIGLITAIGHHSYYTSLTNDRVGGESQQQWSLRFGTAFAYITQISLVASVGIAYTQWLWRTLSRTDLSIDCLDAAFDADTAIISLLNKELIKKIRVGALLALLCWCLQLPSLITPATLTVLPTFKVTVENRNVSSLEMYNGDSQTRRYTTSFNTSDSKSLLFSGPRTVISRLVKATATEGMILPIQAPFPNSTYTVEFYGPAIRCEEASSTVVPIIESLREEARLNHTGYVKQLANWYYGFVPNLERYGNSTLRHNGVEALADIKLQQPTNGSNELWMVYARYTKGYGHLPPSERPIEDRYTTCKLYNASYFADLGFQEGIQNVNTRKTLLNAVDYPPRDAPPSNKTMIQHAYSAVMWAITDLLVGEMGTFQTDPEFFGGGGNGPTNFSEIRTQIAHTSLLGSTDLRVFFDKNRAIWSKDAKQSDQTTEDIKLAQNRTLDVLIEELSVNVTMSFMNSQLLSPPVIKPVTLSRSINTYRYSSRNLFLAYGLAILFALLANILGIYAFWNNKASHSRMFSAKVLTRRGKKLVKLVDEGAGRQGLGLRAPLPDGLREMRVRFDTATWSFGVVEEEGEGKEKKKEGNKLRRKSAAGIGGVQG